MVSGERLRSASETRLNINVDIVRASYPDHPPSYEEAMNFNPAEGVLNLVRLSFKKNEIK